MFNASNSMPQFDFLEEQTPNGGGDEPNNNSTVSSGDSNTTNITPNMDNSMDRTKLIVNYIPQFATEADLGEIFAGSGEVESIKIMRDYKTGYSFGFGFVKYCKEEDAARAIRDINGMNFKNKRLKVSYSRPAGAEMKDSNLYISNLPRDITEYDVQQLFQPYGEIVQTTVLKDKITGMPRGVAFVRYAKGDQAQLAITELHGKLLDNAMYPLSVRVAEDHGRQKAQYLDRLQNRMMAPPPLQLSYHHRNGGGGGGGGGMMHQGAPSGGGGSYRGQSQNINNYRNLAGGGDDPHHHYYH